MSVFVTFTWPEAGDSRILGVYTSLQQAQAALDRDSKVQAAGVRHHYKISPATIDDNIVVVVDEALRQKLTTDIDTIIRQLKADSDWLREITRHSDGDHWENLKAEILSELRIINGDALHAEFNHVEAYIAKAAVPLLAIGNLDYFVENFAHFN